MNPTSGRQIFKQGSSGDVAALLQTIFISEIIRPGSSLWLVSPWISDIPVIDNRTGGFLHLEPRWPLGPVPLSEVLATALRRGTRLHIITRPPRSSFAPNDPGNHNERFLNELTQRIPEDALLCIRKEEEQNLHIKGLLGDRFFLSGSMNFTFNGITLNEEFVRFTTNQEEVAQARLAFRQAWGNSV